MPGAPAKGPIVLQHHGGFNSKTKEWSSASALVQFRNLKIKELPKQKSDNEKNWTNLFKGKDFEGWLFYFGKKGTENNGTFTIRNGILHCTGEPAGYMYSKKSYRNYTLQMELAFERPDGLEKDSAFRGNSGVLVHVGEKHAIGVWPRSIEVQGMHRDLGQILPIPRNLKCTHTNDKTARKKVLKPVGQWNKIEIDVNGGDMIISLNGTVVSTVSNCELTEGPIGFQSEGAATRWKNIRILNK
jgi:hypothetical protein